MYMYMYTSTSLFFHSLKVLTEGQASPPKASTRRLDHAPNNSSLSMSEGKRRIRVGVA